MPKTLSSRWLTGVLAVLSAALMVALVTAPQADASHEPANKVAAAGSDVDRVTTNTPILSETVRVSSSHDLILSTTAECTILTSLLTDDNAVGNEQQPPGTSAFSFGSVRLQILIDGKPVPVAAVEATGGDDAADDDDELGEVTFCNRAYQRTVSDTEENEGGTNPNGDGVDRQDDFIKTRTANGFNWLALDVGFNYDEACATFDPQNPGSSTCQATISNGNNIVQIDVIADYDVEPEACNAAGPDNNPTALSNTCADAFVGSRTLIAEPTNASVHEMVNETANSGS